MGAVLLLISCSNQGRQIPEEPPVSSSDVESGLLTQALRSELESLWRQRAFLFAQVILEGQGFDEPLLTNSVSIARTLDEAFGQTQANIAESHLVANGDLASKYLLAVTKGGAGESGIEPGRPGLARTRQALVADIEKLADYFWLLTSAARQVLRSLMSGQIRLVVSGDFGRAIGLGTEIGYALTLGYQRSNPAIYRDSTDASAAILRSRLEARNEKLVYQVFLSRDPSILGEPGGMSDCKTIRPPGHGGISTRGLEGTTTPEFTESVIAHVMKAIALDDLGDNLAALKEVNAAILTTRAGVEASCK